MKKNLFLLLLFFSTSAFSSAYFGANYGYSMFSSKSLEEYKVSAKGPTYGGFLGIGRDFVGLELFYQDFQTEGKIKHDGGSYDLIGNAKAMGAALRFSFDMFYLRLGVAKYTLNQSLDIDDATVRSSAEAVYDIQDEGSKANGAIYGIGVHRKFSSLRTFIDYTRYQINSIGTYDTISVGVSFAISDNLFKPGKY